jgi:hypothetical protein
MQDMIDLIIGMIFCLLGVIVVWQYGLRYLTHYKIEDTGLKIVSFGIRFARIKYENIELVKKLTTKEACTKYWQYLGAWNYPNRLWGSFIFIQQKGVSIRRNLLITPDNIEQFITELKKHLPADTVVEL